MSSSEQNNFWSPQSISELAKAQGIEGAQCLDELTGAAKELWQDDAEFERFMNMLTRQRREASAA